MRFLLFGVLLACASEEPPPTFAEVYDEILAPSCGFSSCHGGAAGAPFLDSAEEAYQSLVNAASAQDPSMTLVIPGDPDNSYLVQKLEDAPGISGDSMPPSSALPEEKIQSIRDWISAGALQD